MHRRNFMKSAVGLMAVWPSIVSAQQPARPTRKIGVLIAATASDREYQGRLAALQQKLAQLGWVDARNVQFDVRWATNADEIRRQATGLVAGQPDVIVAASGTTTISPLLEATSSIPIVFVLAIDPVGAGFVSSLARPSGNATGFLMFEYDLSVKWLELLKQLAPEVKRVAVLRDAAVASGIGQFGAIRSAAPSMGFEPSPFNVRDGSEIERDITAFARSPNGGLIVTSSPRASLNRELIISLASKHKLPAIYAGRHFVEDGGLVAYGPDAVDQYRRTADYVDRLLNGERPAELPVQAPTKYELLVNLKTAKAMGISIPLEVLSRADEVVE